MTRTPEILPVSTPVTSPVGSSSGARAGREITDFITRMHFYIGLFVGPFILVAALTGTLYVLTPQLENALYADVLTTPSVGADRSLEDQVNAARAWRGDDRPVFAVRPATAAGRTTRVMFTDPALGESETRAIFVDPVTLEIRGDLTVYGTSGILPLRLTIDKLHRSLMLGDTGRLYSELAASWLWVASLGGIVLWAWRRRTDRQGGSRQTPASRTRRLHSTIGVWIAAGLLFLSVTGLTWSKHAGDNIDAMRMAFGWVTPSVSLTLKEPPAAAPVAGDHADHAAHAETASPAALPDAAALMDAIYATARAAGIDSPMVEIRPAKTADRAWMVREYDRSTPTQVDTIAIDPRTMAVTSRADFDTFTLLPKLIRWGIDLHMGIKFGLVNQIVMVVIGTALTAAVAYGYVLWWRRRPVASGPMPVRTLLRSWAALPTGWKIGSGAVALGLGLALPVMGASLLLFLIVDTLRWGRARRLRQRKAAA